MARKGLLFLLVLLFMQAHTSAVFARDSRRALSAARRAFDSGLMPEARSKFERYLVVYPDTSHLGEVLSLLCSAYAAQDDFTGGLEYLRSLRKLVAGPAANAQVDCAEADLLFRNKDYAGARGIAEKLLSALSGDDPLYGRAKFLYAMALFHDGLYGRAEPVLSELQNDSQYGVESSLYLSECLLELGRYATSRKVLGRVMSDENDPQSYPYSLFLAGKLDYMEGRAGEAEEAFVKADAADVSGQLRPRMSFGRAVLYRRFSRFDLSNQQLEMLRGDSSYRTEADLLYVKNLISQQKYDEAIEEVSNCIGQYHPDAAAHLLFWKGEAYMGKRAWVEAVEVYDGIIAAYPDFALADECHYRIGWCMMQSGRQAEAVDLLVRRLPDLSGAGLKLAFTRLVAQCYFALGQFQLSARFYMDAAALAPEGSEAEELRIMAGRAWYQLGDWNNALKVWLELASGATDARLRMKSVYNSGWVYFRQNDFKHAFNQFKTVARQLEFPLLKVKALFQMGNLYFYRGDYNTAARYFRKIAAFFPDVDRKISEFSLYRAGYCLGRSGRADEAYAVFNRLLERFPESRYCPQVLFSLGSRDYNRANYYSAYRRFSAVVESFPENALAPDAAFWLAKSVNATGNSGRAVEILERLLASSTPSNYHAEAEMLCARLLADCGQTGRAVEILERAAADTARPFVRNQALLELGNIELGRGDFKSAIDFYERIPEDAVGPVLAEGGCCRGRALLKLGREDEALDAFTEVVFGLPSCEKWVVASAMEAGAVMEKKDRLKDAVLLYTKVKNDYESGRVRANRRLDALKERIPSTPADKPV